MSIDLKSVELDVAPEVTESIESQLSPYLFGVEEREVAFNIMGQKSASQVFSKTSKYKSIIDLRTNQLISIQPKTYKLVTNKEVIAPLMEQLHQVDNKWFIDKSHSFVEQNRMRLQITFPELTVEDDSGKDGIALSWFIHNSYDASEGIRSYWGGIRGICTNGSVFGHLLAKYYHRHTSGFNVKNLKNEIEATYHKIPELKQRLEILGHMQVTEKDMGAVEKISKTMNGFVKAQPGKIESRLALYHILTYYISHCVQLQARARYQFAVSKMFNL